MKKSPDLIEELSREHIRAERELSRLDNIQLIMRALAMLLEEKHTQAPIVKELERQLTERSRNQGS